MKSSNILNLVVIIISAAIIIFIYAAAVFNQKRFFKLKLKCPKCGHIWKPYELGTPSSFILLGPTYLLRYLWLRERWFLRCPQCRRFSWCHIIEETEKLD